MQTDFSQRLRAYLDSLAQARAQSTHHDGLRHRFLDFLQNAFPSLDAKELELEYPVKALGIRGYIDALYRHVLFEFKRDLSREGPKGGKSSSATSRPKPSPSATSVC